MSKFEQVYGRRKKLGVDLDTLIKELELYVAAKVAIGEVHDTIFYEAQRALASLSGLKVNFPRKPLPKKTIKKKKVEEIVDYAESPSPSNDKYGWNEWDYATYSHN